MSGKLFIYLVISSIRFDGEEFAINTKVKMTEEQAEIYKGSVELVEDDEDEAYEAGAKKAEGEDEDLNKDPETDGVESLQSTISDLEAINKAISDDLKTSDNLNETLEAKNTEQVKANKSLSNDKDELEAKLKEANAEISALKKQLEVKASADAPAETKAETKPETKAKK